MIVYPAAESSRAITTAPRIPAPETPLPGPRHADLVLSARRPADKVTVLLSTEPHHAWNGAELAETLQIPKYNMLTQLANAAAFVVRPVWAGVAACAAACALR
jgi:hypothetical protein